MLLKGIRRKNEDLVVYFEIQRFSRVTEEKVEARANALNLTDRYLRQNFKKIEVYHGEKLIYKQEFTGEASPDVGRSKGYLISPPPVKKSSKLNPRPKQKEAFKPLAKVPPGAEKAPERALPQKKTFKEKPKSEIPTIGDNTADVEPVMNTGDIRLVDVAEAVKNAPKKRTIKVKKPKAGAPRKVPKKTVKMNPKKSTAKKSAGEEENGA